MTRSAEHPDTTTSQSASSRSMQRRVQWSGFFGAVMEWYDFYLYSFASATLFGPLFFPQASAAVGVLASFATLAVGFVVRPLGGLLFGHFGDRIGRRGVLVFTLALMGGASTLMGVLPTYAAAGIWAPVLLVLLRIAQGISAGGEWAGGVLMTIEHASGRRRALATSGPQMGLYAGIVLANAVFLLVSLLPHGQLFSWGWRLPFLGSIVLVGIALWIRLGINETPVFKAAQERNAISKRPLAGLFRNHRRALLIVILLVFGVSSIGSFKNTFLASYAIQMNYSTTAALTIPIVGEVLAGLLVPVFSAASDRFGRKNLAATGSLLMILGGWLSFVGIGTHNLAIAILCVILLCIPHSMVYGPIAAWVSELFPTGNRYGGVSVGYQVGTTLGSGFLPLIAAALLLAGGGAPHYGLVLAYLAFVCLLNLAGVVMARETAHASFEQIDGATDRPSRKPR